MAAIVGVICFIEGKVEWHEILLADLFLYSYESEFLDNTIRGGHRKLARSFSLCYRYIDDLIVFNNKKFGDYVKEIYPSQLTVEKANTSDDLANYLDLTFIIESNNRLTDFTGYVLFIITSFLAGVESTDQCLLNSKVLSCFSGVIMSIRSFFLFSLTSKLFS